MTSNYTFINENIRSSSKQLTVVFNCAIITGAINIQLQLVRELLSIRPSTAKAILHPVAPPLSLQTSNIRWQNLLLILNSELEIKHTRWCNTFKHDMIAKKQKMSVSKANKEDGSSLCSQSKLPCSSCYSSTKQISTMCEQYQNNTTWTYGWMDGWINK